MVAAVTLLSVVDLARAGGFLFDFRGDLWNVGRAILAGHAPYHPAFLARLAASVAPGHVAPPFATAVYPAPVLVAAAPLALLPATLAGVLFLAGLVAATIGGLRLLGVRDGRCIVIALVSWPSLFGLELGAIGPLLLLGIGVAWRWRRSTAVPAVAVAAVIVAKVFPWTLLGWLAATRRVRSLLLAVVVGGLALAAGWAVIGFDGLTAYPRMLSDLATIEHSGGTSLVTLLIRVGVPGTAATAAGLSVAGGLLGVAARYAHRDHGDRVALGLAIVAALVATPVAWPHYYLLLYVPIALTSPRLSALWLAPLITILAPTPAGVGALVLWLALTVFVAIALVRSTGAESRPARATSGARPLTAGAVRA